MTKRKIETIAITAGRNIDTQIGAVMPPIHLTTTFVRGNAGEFIYYPGLESHPGHEIAKRQMRDFGGMLSVQVNGGGEMAAAVVDKTKIFVKATSLGGVESLIEHRAPVEGENTKTPKDLIRISVGLEHPDDLIEDLVQALR